MFSPCYDNQINGYLNEEKNINERENVCNDKRKTILFSRLFQIIIHTYPTHFPAFNYV